MRFHERVVFYAILLHFAPLLTTPAKILSTLFHPFLFIAQFLRKKFAREATSLHSRSTPESTSPFSRERQGEGLLLSESTFYGMNRMVIGY